MLLNIKKRILILSVLPNSASINDQAICKDISNKVRIDGATVALIGLREDEKNILHWDVEKEEIVDVEFSETEKLFLKNIIDELDKNKLVTPDNLELCLEIKSL